MVAITCIRLLLLDQLVWPEGSITQKLWQSCCRKGDLFQDLKLGSCLTPRNELSEETHADKARDFVGKGHPGREQSGKGAQENCSAAWLAVWGFMVMGLVSSYLWPIILIQSPSWWCMPCSAKMDASEKDSGRWSNMWCLLLTFPNSPDWWWLISSVFLPGTSCGKTAHAKDYYGAWPGWAVPWESYFADSSVEKGVVFPVSAECEQATLS